MPTWNEIKLPAEEERLWELFHENSKLSPYFPLTQAGEDSRSNIDKMHVSLPVQSAFTRSIEATDDPVDDLFQRVFFSQGVDTEHHNSVSFALLSRILRASALIWRRDSESGLFLSPLELYAFINGIDQLPQGLYHFDPQKLVLQLVNTGVSVEQLSDAFPDDKGAASIYVFITALFQRTANTLGERGYRVALTESGRLMQNIILTCALHSQRARPIINFYDRKVEHILALDGVTHSVLQVIAI